jgi:hypothetical protein
MVTKLANISLLVEHLGTRVKLGKIDNSGLKMAAQSPVGFLARGRPPR